MNLRVDTEVQGSDHKVPLTLFHVRMQDLKSRQFSIRRYCRDSGREVCHTNRLYTKSDERRASDQRSFSDILAASSAYSSGHRRTTSSSVGSIRSRTSTSSLTSVREEPDSSDEDNLDDSMTNSKKARVQPTRTTKLKFSNYAFVHLSYRRKNITKGYEFEFWGTTYCWKRTVSRDGTAKRVSFHLVKGDSGDAIAHFVPEMRSPGQVRDEEKVGGWIPPYSMWIADEQAVWRQPTDIADVIVCTGLVALIDYSIKSRFSKKQAKASLTQSTLGTIEYMSPRALVHAIFKRRGPLINSLGSHR
jgi:hypothetical protein